jgi:hypothetical protein
MACKRSRGQPLDSKRHIVLCHKAAVSPLPCTNTTGDRGASLVGSVPEQAPSNRVEKAKSQKCLRGKVMRLIL